MKLIYVFIALALSSCYESDRKTKTTGSVDSIGHATDSIHKQNDENEMGHKAAIKTYSNTRFKEVKVEKTGEHKYTVEGKGQIFEANFNWVVEDGHEELLKGYQMTDAGAPEWGYFKFSFEVQKRRPNSTMTLILFESSAKDGSRQYELPIVLE